MELNTISVSWTRKQILVAGFMNGMVVVSLGGLDVKPLEEWKNWAVVNDGVMGGLSQSRAVISNHGTLMFTGVVSLANNGGFASIRHGAESFDLGRGEGILVRVSGDGKKYEFKIPEIHVTSDAVRKYRFASPLFGSSFGDMELVELNKGLGRYFGTDTGLLVVNAPRSEALKLQDGDVIQSIDGREPTSVGHAMRILSSYQAGEKVELGIMRDKRRQTLDIEMPDDRSSMLMPLAPLPPLPAMPADVDVRVLTVPRPTQRT